MITQVEIFTPRVSVSPIDTDPAGNEFTDPIRITNIDGLGPVTAAINTTQYGSLDGSAYNGSSVGQRNIVLTVALNPNWVDQTPESIRQALYSYFMPKNQVTLRFSSTHMATVEIDGYVESMTPNLFDKDALYQVSIICPKPEFVASTPTVITGETIALPDGDPLDLEYEGNLPTGFVLDVVQGSATAMTAGEIRVLNENPNEQAFIVTADVNGTTSLEISTVIGDKYVSAVAVSDGTQTSIMGKNTVGNTWLQLQEGTNNFRIASTQAGQSWTMTYNAKYGGL